MRNDQFTLRMILEDPFGKSYQVAMPIDAFHAADRYMELTPPSPFDVGTQTFDQVVERIRKKEYRKEDFRIAAIKLATALGERMEDEEGWHGIERQERYEAERRS